MAVGWLLFVLALLTSVVVHEAGHMCVAKLFGVKVTRFFFGFGPTVWSFRRGETEYGIKAIPVGGFVNIVGQAGPSDVAPEDVTRALCSRPLWQRVAVFAAGVVSNGIVCLLLLLIVNIGFPSANGMAAVGDLYPCIGSSIEPCNSAHPPAPAYGHLQSGDVITSVDGRNISGGSRQAASLIGSATGQTVLIELRRSGRPIIVSIVPVTMGSDHLIGVGLKDAVSRLGVLKGVENGTRQFGTATVGSIVAFKDVPAGVVRLFSPSGPPGVVSIVGAGRLSAQAYSYAGISAFLSLIAIINLSIGLINLVPLLPLDGGHIALALYRGGLSRIARSMGKSVSSEVNYERAAPFLYIGLLLLLGVGVAAILNDLLHPAANPFTG